MLYHSPTTAVFLLRRSRLLQACSCHSAPSSLSLPDQSRATSMQKWLVSLGQLLDSTMVSMQAAKALIESVSPQTINTLKTEIVSLLMAAVWLHSGSKLSNIIYYLCRRCPNFMKQIVPHLDSYRDGLIKQRTRQGKKACGSKQSQYMGEMLQKWGIILTDMFVFGIHFTQHQFVTDILPSVLAIENMHMKAMDAQLQPNPKSKSTLKDEPLMQRCMFQIGYICRYLQVLSLPSAMVEHCRIKMTTQLSQLIITTYVPLLARLRQHMRDCCSSLQQAYSQASSDCPNREHGRITAHTQPQSNNNSKQTNNNNNNTQQTAQQQPVQIEKQSTPCTSDCICQKQQAYLSSMHEYEYFRSSLLRTLQLATACWSVCGRNCKYESVQHLRDIVANQYETILHQQVHSNNYNNNNINNNANSNGQQKQSSNFNDMESKTADKSEQQSGEGDLLQSGYDQSCDVIQPQTLTQTLTLTQTNNKSKRTKQERQQLTKIYNSCKYYQNKAKIVFDPLYTHIHSHTYEVDTMPTNVPQMLHNEYHTNAPKYLDELPTEYIQKLKNCSTQDQSHELSRQFIQEYNKHSNRVILTNAIFDELYNRNNLPFIVRVLSDVYQVQPDEIQQLLVNKVKQIGSTGHGKIGKGLYGRYSQLATELVKFELYSADEYLGNLLRMVREMSGIPATEQQQQQQQSGQSSSISNNSDSSPQQLYMSSLIAILQKLGQQVYYCSLHAHILMNQIIDAATEHMRKKTISYELETINRFNCIIHYLRNTSSNGPGMYSRYRYNRGRDNEDRVLMDILKDDTLFWEQVSTIHQSIQVNETQIIDKLTKSLANSIEYENYMESYYFAQLIYEINSKPLQKCMVNLTYHKIKEGLTNGNFQGAANWGRFLGQLNRYQVLPQADMLAYFSTEIMFKLFSSQPCACIKVICACIQTCGSYLKATNQLADMNRVLCWLLQLKVELLKVNGLQNNLILEQEVEDLFEYFHIGFKYMRCVADCQQVYDKIQESQRNQHRNKTKSKAKPKVKAKAKGKQKSKYQSKDKQKTVNFDVEFIIDEYYNECIKKEQQISKPEQCDNQVQQQQQINKVVVNGYLAKQDKYVPKDNQNPIKYKEKQQLKPIENDDFIELSILQNACESQGNRVTQIRQKQMEIGNKKQRQRKKQDIIIKHVSCEDENQSKAQVKKIKVIGRPKNSKLS